MRVLVSVDMEGVAGVVARDDIRPGHAEYEWQRRAMTEEANAAVRGVLAVDPEATVVVCDAHAGFRNLLPERLERRCRLLRGSPRPYSMLTGIDGGVDAVVLIGHHGRAGTPRSVLAHTVSGATLTAVRCNGRELGEIGLNAALASHFGADTVLVSGDDTAAREAEDLVPGIGTVAVKRAVGAGSAESLHPADACDRIEAATAQALRHPPATRFTVDGPVRLEVDVLHTVMTELAVLVPGIDQIGPKTLAADLPDIAVAYGLVDVIATLAAAAIG